jgi:NAD+ diphosphatase
MSLNNFCNRCGSNQLESKENMLYCNGCGLETYLNPKPTTNVIFYHEDKVLIAQRAKDPFKDLWGLPGGFMENGENLEQSLVREVLEELAIELDNPKYFCSIYNEEYIYKGENYSNICVYFYAPISLEKFNSIQPADDVAAVKLITRDQIKTLDFCFGINNLLHRFFDEISSGL